MSTLLELEISKQQSDLITVVRAQHECITDHGWWDVWCVEDEAHHETHHGTLEEFTARLVGMGWDVESLERSTAICPACQNAEDESHYAAQYADGSGGLL